jgi:hypothetical protein
MNTDPRKTRKIHPDFRFYLDFKSIELIKLYEGIRLFILDAYPDANELLYHTHALTSLYSVTEKMYDGFCMIPIYTNHLNLGFNKGTLLPDPQGLLQGTGKLIRHIPITHKNDYNNAAVKKLVKASIQLALEDAEKMPTMKAQTISKIKR